MFLYYVFYKYIPYNTYHRLQNIMFIEVVYPVCYHIFTIILRTLIMTLVNLTYPYSSTEPVNSSVLVFDNSKQVASGKYYVTIFLTV